MTIQKDPLYKSIASLRDDALERQMLDLGVAYGWALLRRGEEILGRQMTDLERYSSLKDGSPGQ